MQKKAKKSLLRKELILSLLIRIPEKRDTNEKLKTAIPDVKYFILNISTPILF